MKAKGDSLKEYARGITGGLIFSLPLLYTMEVWWAGFSVQPIQLLVYIIAGFLLLLGYNRYAGVHEGAAWKEVVIDSVEEIGIGLVLSFGILWQLGRISFADMMTDEIVGKVVVESMTVAIGVSIGTAQLGNAGESNGNHSNKERKVSSTGQAVLALCGAILIAGNVAPTEEIPMVAMEVSPLHLLGIVMVSLLLGAIILFFSDFRRGHPLPANKMLLTVTFDTVLAYMIALGSAAFMLWFFGRFNEIHFNSAISMVIILGLPAMLGASAGKLLIKQ